MDKIEKNIDDPENTLLQTWTAYKTKKDVLAREQLILLYAPLVKYIAGRLSVGLPSSVDQADLVSSGIFGLMDAIEKFDLERGLKFETYATPRIRGAIIDEMRREDWVPRSIRKNHALWKQPTVLSGKNWDEYPLMRR